MWDFFREFYYMNLLLVIVSIILIVYGIVNYKKLAGLRLFIIYALASLIQLLLVITTISLGKFDEYQNTLLIQSINYFVLLDFILLYFFLYKLLTSKKVRMGMKISFFTFILFILYSFFLKDEIFKHPNIISLIEAFLIIIPVLFYINQCLINLPFKRLSDNPEFWVIVGVLFLFSTITPLFLVNTFFPQMLYGSIYTLNYVSYTLLFICILYAFICKTKQATS